MLSEEAAFPVSDDVDIDLPEEDELAVLDADNERIAAEAAPRHTLAREPLLHNLFARSVEVSDTVLRDFTQHVLTPLCDVFGMASAKGGKYARDRQADRAAGQKLRSPQDYFHDQTMRAHLLNGMLPALRIARQLAAWVAPRLCDWTEETERLFIAGYLLHDYTKLEGVKQEFDRHGFGTFTAPNEGKMDLIEAIFLEWGGKLGIDVFLEPLGGMRLYLHDIIFIALNTQELKDTARLPALLKRKHTHPDVYMLATDVSRLADLIAYVGRTPRDVVAHESIRGALDRLAFAPDVPGMRVARLTYHHVAENRGVLLNFIHDAVLADMTADPDLRIPLLFAPSGVVYLERYDAPPPSPIDMLITQIVDTVQQNAGERLIRDGKGAKVSKDGLRVDTSYNDYFDLRQFISKSPGLLGLVRSNAPQYLEKLQALGFPHTQSLPPLSFDKTDTRLRRMAEWASLVEVQIEERYPQFGTQFVTRVLESWGISDLQQEFTEVATYKPEREGTGIRYHWYWAALYALAQKPWYPEEVDDRIVILSHDLAAALPDDLPDSAQIDQTKWRDLADYLGRILTVGGSKAEAAPPGQEITRYIDSKKTRGGGAVCAMCGDAYAATKPNETTVAFQPGVYTARVKIGASSNTRSLCSICALEQLLRQLFVDNLDAGSRVEGQRVRYLSFYPSYFFTPETLQVVRDVYHGFREMRLSDRDLRGILNDADLTDPHMWTRLESFLLRQPDQPPSRRVLRYGEEVGGAFFMIGLRNFDPKTDIESWILPAFVAFVMTVNLDLKVVISEGSVPLITETTELAETVWFDGAHPAIRAVLDAGRAEFTDRYHVDDVLPALARLVAAYLIHLDTEYAPPDENWRRFPPIAHALAESPLYVFHYLKKQERDDPEHKPINRDRALRYLSYASLLADPKGKDSMSIARNLVEQYRLFYRADNFKNSNSILRPINVVADAILNAAVLPSFREPDALFEVAYGELFKFIDRVGKGLADGRFPKGISVVERTEAMREFCRLFVNDLFIRDFNGDAAALRGKPLNLLKNACEVIYRDMQYTEWAERGREADETADNDDNGNNQ